MTDIYTIGSWKGKKTYRCTRCAFDSLSENAILEHYASVHAAQPIMSSSIVLVADKNGNQVQNPSKGPAAQREEIFR